MIKMLETGSIVVILMLVELFEVSNNVVPDSRRVEVVV